MTCWLDIASFVHASKKTFIDLKSKSAVDENEFLLVQDLCYLLEPVKHTSNAVCRNDSTLLSADASLDWLVEQLSKDTSLLGPKLHAAVVARISERRDPVLVALLKYLHNPVTPIPVDFMGVRVTKKSILQLAETLFDRLKLMTHEDHVIDEQVDDTPSEEKLDLKSELQKAIDAALSTNKTPVVVNNIAADFKLYDAQKERTNKLDLLYNALLTIKPSSVEAERTFSTSGNFATKIRSRLRSDTLSALVMLKRHFQSQKK